MQSNRRLNLRKIKKTNDGNQSISNFVEKRPQRACDGAVEIVVDDDDEAAQEHSDQYEFKDETLTRPLRRRKKQIFVEENDEENNDDEMQGLEDMDENEREQIKEALRQSRLQMEQDAKRREIYKKFQNSNFGAVVDMPSTSGVTADLPSSPISSSIDVPHQQRAESPELFGTPQPSYEQSKPSGETPKDSASDKSKSPFKTHISIRLSPITSHPIKTSYGSPQTVTDHEQEKGEIDSTETNEQNEHIGKVKRSLNFKKRKHTIDESDDDDFDGAKESVKVPIAEESKKKQKTLDDVVSRTRNEKKEQEGGREKEQFVIYDDEESQDTSESEKRPNSVKKHKKSYRVSLQRTYKKPKLAIRTIRDAMKSRLLFAPPGIDHKLYTYAIIRLLDQSKNCVIKAQKKCTKFVEWGLPVVAGPRVEDTLDAKRDRKGNAKKEPRTVTTSELKTRRSLRSAQSKTNDIQHTTKTDSKQNETVEVKKEKDPIAADDFKLRTKNMGYVDSDSEEELNKPAFDYKQDNPKNWDEYNSKSKTFAFGENVNTSTALPVDRNNKTNRNTVDNQGSKNEKRKCNTQENKSDDIIIQQNQNVSQNSKKDNQDSNKNNNNIKETSQNSKNIDPSDLYFTANRSNTTDRTAVASENSPKANKSTTRNIADTELNQKNAQSNVSPKKSTRKDSRTQNSNSDNVRSSPKKAHSQNVPEIEESESITSSFKTLSKDFDKKSTRKSPRKFTQTKTVSNADSDSDTIDSSAEIGQGKKRRLSYKVPVIEDQDEGDPSFSGSGVGKVDVDIDLVHIDDSTPTESNTIRPGESLSNAAATCKSGFLKADRREPKVQEQNMTEASRRAAEAAEKRMNKEKTKSRSPEPTSDSHPTKENWPADESEVECPMCYAAFPLKDIETHAATCNGTPPEPNQTDQNSRRGMSSKHQQQSVIADPTPELSQEYGLKKLQVVVTRSPVADRKLTEQSNSTSYKARRNLSLTKKDKAAESSAKSTAEIVDMTTDDGDDDNIPIDQDDGSQSRDSSQGPQATWLASESQELRKKEKYKVTYGGKKTIGTLRNPFSTLDFIPLEDKQPSSDSDSETNSTSNKKQLTKQAKTTPTTQTGKWVNSGDDSIDIDSASDSDNEMFSSYNKKKTNNSKTKNINDILRPKKQELILKKRKKEKPRDDFDDDDLANERALMELAGISEKSPSPDRVKLRKRPSSDRMNQPRGAKRRRKRATLSSDESDENDDYQMCYICDKRILKEIYTQHTEECLKEKLKNECHEDTVNSPARNNKPTARPSTSNTIEMDSDEIGDSPIKTFKLIGQEDNSAVDYNNQFAFFGGKTRAGSNRGSKGTRGRGRGKPKFKKHWRRKKRGG